MKKLILSLTLVAFAMAVQAGDTKDSKTKIVSGKAKASTTTTAKAECSEATKAKAGDCATACCKPEPKKQVLLSPKAAAEKGI